MSSEVDLDQEQKIVVDYNDNELLQVLDLPAMLKEHRKIAEKIDTLEAEKKSVTKDIEAAIYTVESDTVTYKDWRATYIPDNPNATKTDPDRFRLALSTIGKLDAATIAEIYKAAEVPSPHKGYVKVTYPKKPKKAK